jgi:hypothetical protein
VTLAVVVNIGIKGLTVTQFTVVQDKFKQAIALTVSCSADKINITSVIEVPDSRRLNDIKTVSIGAQGEVFRQLKQQAGGTHLAIEFAVLVTSSEQLQSTVSTFQGVSYIDLTTDFRSRSNIRQFNIDQRLGVDRSCRQCVKCTSKIRENQHHRDIDITSHTSSNTYTPTIEI